jgi:hypothetical protein
VASEIVLRNGVSVAYDATMADEAWVLSEGTVVSMRGHLDISGTSALAQQLFKDTIATAQGRGPYVGVGEHRSRLDIKDAESVYDWLCQRCYEVGEKIASGPVPGTPRPPLPPGTVY